MSERQGRPAFAKDFPSDPRLDALLAAFARGDYAAVRRAAPELLGEGVDAEVRRAASELRRRTKPDGTMVFLLALTGALLVALASYWWSRGA